MLSAETRSRFCVFPSYSHEQSRQTKKVRAPCLKPPMSNVSVSRGFFHISLLAPIPPPIVRTAIAARRLGVVRTQAVFPRESSCTFREELGASRRYWL